MDSCFSLAHVYPRHCSLQGFSEVDGLCHCAQHAGDSSFSVTVVPLHMNLQVVNLCLSSFWCSGFPFDLSFRMDLRKLMILNFFRFLIVVRVV